MLLTALCAIERENDEQLAIADSETGKVFLLNFHARNAVSVDGAYSQRFTLGSDEIDKHGKRLLVEGSCEDVITGTLTVTMDGKRVFMQDMIGPYNPLQGLLFFQEFDPALLTGKVFVMELSKLRGIGVEVTDMKMEATPIDQPGR